MGEHASVQEQQHYTLLEEGGAEGAAAAEGATRPAPAASLAAGAVVPECRICGESEVSKTNRFISPCECSGSISQVHVECLERWILQRPGNRDAVGENLECEICHTRYRISLRHRLRVDAALLCSCSTFAHLIEAALVVIAVGLLLGVTVSDTRSFNDQVSVPAAVIAGCCLLLALRRLCVRWFRSSSIPRVSIE